MVPIASKKFVNTSVKTSMRRGEHADALEASRSSTWPIERQVGQAHDGSGSAGTVSPQPPGLPLSTCEPRFQIASTMTASTVPLTRPIRMRARDLARDQDAGEQQGDHEDERRHGGDRAADAEADGRRADAVEVTKPASTKPMKAMKRPMPTVIASFSWMRHGVEDHAPQAGRGQQHDDEAVDDHEAHRLGPGHLADDAHREERVDAETGREGERQARHEAEQDRHDAGGQRGDGGDLGEPEAVAVDIRRRSTG